MAVVNSQRLDSLTEKTRSKPVGWDGYARANLLSAQDVELVQSITNARNSEEILKAKAETYAQLYTRLLNNLNRTEARAVVLVLLGDFISVEERIQIFSSSSISPHQALLKLIESPDEFIRLKSAANLCTIVSYEEGDEFNIIAPLLSSLAKLICSNPPKSSSSSTRSDTSFTVTGDPDTQSVAVQCVATLFKREDIRRLAWSREVESNSKSHEGQTNGDTKDESRAKVISSLLAVLRLCASGASGSGRSTPANTSGSHGTSPLPPSVGGMASQLQYNVGFAFWLLSFEKSFCDQVNKTLGDLIPLLMELAKDAVKEKVVRIVLATFKNLVTLSPSNLPALLLAKAQPYMQQLQSSRKWSDEDLREDVDFLSEELKKAKQKLTTYDEYSAELESGQLTWSPPHEDAEFWRENADKLNKKDLEQLKALIKLLNTSKDPSILAISLNDVAQYVKYSDSGKKNIENLGGKAKAMELLNHPDPDVKFRALMAVQKLISHPWAS